MVKLKLPRFKSKKAVITVLAICVLLVVIAGYLLYQSRTVDGAEHRAKMAEVQELWSKSDFQKVETVLNEYLKKRMSDEYRYEATASMASNYTNLKNPQASLDWYRRAEAIDPDGSYAVALGIADGARALDDKATAISYYHRAIELVRGDEDQFNDSYISTWEKIIQKLESNQPVEEDFVLPNYDEFLKNNPPPAAAP